MKYLSNKMLALMERLSEMFPGSSYQTRLDQYLSSKGITDAAQLENYINEFNYNKEKYIWKQFSTTFGQYLIHLAELELLVIWLALDSMKQLDVSWQNNSLRRKAYIHTHRGSSRWLQSFHTLKDLK